MTNYSKGTDLENAVEAIEKIILQFIGERNLDDIDMFPKYKKIPGYEIDLYIHIKDKLGYDTIFIFECKNWDTEKVGRKEITDFAEKIDKSKAQKGFFIAKSFTEDAIRRIEEDGRIEQVLASNVVNIPMIFWEAKILDEENSKIHKVKSTEIELDGEEITSIEMNGKNINQLDLIEEIIDPKYVNSKFYDRIKQTFKNNKILINGVQISNIKKLNVDIKYLTLDAKIDMAKVFGIKNRGSHLTISHYAGEEKIFDTDITGVRNGDRIQYTNTVYNSVRPLKGVSLKIINIKK
jgi:hypothetical protein